MHGMSSATQSRLKSPFVHHLLDRFAYAPWVFLCSTQEANPFDKNHKPITYSYHLTSLDSVLYIDKLRPNVLTTVTKQHAARHPPIHPTRWYSKALLTPSLRTQHQNVFNQKRACSTTPKENNKKIRFLKDTLLNIQRYHFCTPSGQSVHSLSLPPHNPITGTR